MYKAYNERVDRRSRGERIMNKLWYNFRTVVLLIAIGVIFGNSYLTFAETLEIRGPQKINVSVGVRKDIKFYLYSVYSDGEKLDEEDEPKMSFKSSNKNLEVDELYDESDELIGYYFIARKPGKYTVTLKCESGDWDWDKEEFVTECVTTKK